LGRLALKGGGLPLHFCPRTGVSPGLEREAPRARFIVLENITLHSVYDTAKCTRDGDMVMLTAGGDTAIGKYVRYPC
jgi:hypothetical protein